MAQGAPSHSPQETSVFKSRIYPFYVIFLQPLPMVLPQCLVQSRRSVNATFGQCRVARLALSR